MKISDALLILLGLCIPVVAYLAWENRDSEKIMTAVVPAGVAAAAAIILAVTIIGRQPPITETFPTAFCFVTETKLPWIGPWGIGDRWIDESYKAPDKLMEINPAAFSGKTDADAILLYHYLLQWSVVHWMAGIYAANWKAEIMHFDLPDSREGRARSTLTDRSDVTPLQTMEIEQAMEGNPFAKIVVSFPPAIVFPPGTKMTVTTPRQYGDEGEIVVENDLVTLKIRTTNATYGNSIGAYARLAGLSESQDKSLMKVSYLIKITIEFNRWKGGTRECPSIEHGPNKSKLS